MSKPPTIAFFNNKGGVGKTSLVYHIAWMLADMGRPCLAVDLDPQSNLTAAMVEEDDLAGLWEADGPSGGTIYNAIEPWLLGTGDIAEVKPRRVESNLDLLTGDLRLSRFEDQLSQEWPKAHDGHQYSYRVLTSFSRTMHSAALWSGAEIILVDVGPNLGALNRAALIACDYVVVPLAPDLFSLQGLRNLGPTLADWRSQWQQRKDRRPDALAIDLPEGGMHPVGYVLLQHQVRRDRPVKAYARWIERIPKEYAGAMLGESLDSLPIVLDIAADTNCIGTVKHLASLIPMAQEARKPVFRLTAADGAIGSHFEAARKAGEAYYDIALKIIQRCPPRS